MLLLTLKLWKKGNNYCTPHTVSLPFLQKRIFLIRWSRFYWSSWGILWWQYNIHYIQYQLTHLNLCINLFPGSFLGWSVLSIITYCISTYTTFKITLQYLIRRIIRKINAWKSLRISLNFQSESEMLCMFVLRTMSSFISKNTLRSIEFPTYGMKMASWVTNSQNIGSFHCHPHSACWSHSCCSKHSSPTWPRKSVPSFSIYLISSTSTTVITCYLVKMSPPTNWFTRQHAGWTDCPDCIISKVLGF